MLEKFGDDLYFIGEEKVINKMIDELKSIDFDKLDSSEKRLKVSKTINGKEIKALFRGEYVQDYNKLVEDYEKLKVSKALHLMGDHFFIFLHIALNGYFETIDEISQDYDNQYDLFYKYVLSKKNNIPKEKVEAIEFCKYANIFGYTSEKGE